MRDAADTPGPTENATENAIDGSRDAQAQARAAHAWARAGTLAAVSVAGVLLIAKLWAWRVTGSAAVLGQAADSALDLFGSLVAFAAVRYAAQPPDEDHRFGHQKAEALSALLQSLVITASAVLVATESVRRLVAPRALDAPGTAAFVLAGSAAASVALVAFQTLAIRRSQSLVVEGDRAHYLGDVIASLGALVAVLLAARGLHRADAVAGLLAAVFLLWSVREIAGRAWPQLMDQELPEEDRARIVGIVESEPGVLGHHALRTRRAGRRRYVQLHVELDPDMRFADAHAIADRVERRLEAAFPDADVIVHQDPHGVPHTDGPPEGTL